MTLYTTDYLEYLPDLVAWVVNNGIWSILVASGVFALPFVAIVIQEWLGARSEGADEGNKRACCRRCASRTGWVAIVVIMFAGIPFIPVDLATIRFDTTRSAQCQVNVPLPNDTGWSNVPRRSTTRARWCRVVVLHARHLEGRDGRRGGGGDSCGTDLRQIRMDGCHAHRRSGAGTGGRRLHARLLRAVARQAVHEPADALRRADERRHRIGSSYFLDTPGFYDTYRSKTPRTARPTTHRDAGLAQVDSGGGYPSLPPVVGRWRPRTAQPAAGTGRPDLLTPSALGGLLSQSEVNDSAIRAVVSPRQQKMNRGAVPPTTAAKIDKTLPNVVTRGASDLGLTVGSLGFFPAMDAVPGAADGADDAQDGARHLHPAGAADRHLRPERW